MARKSRRLDSDMTQGSIWRQLIEFSLPMMIGLIFQQLYNTVDTIVVGQFVGKEALAAVGTTSSIINMLVGFAAGLSTGEVVFNTALTGYQEVVTDPSYARQLVTLTYPHIGNTGCTPQDDEAALRVSVLVPRNVRVGPDERGAAGARRHTDDAAATVALCV